VDEIAPPVSSSGRYERKPGAAFGPEKALWSYAAPKKSDFFSMLISGAQRLPNGSTLICSGNNGTVFEVTAEKELVWKYVNPAKMEMGPGGPGGFGPPGMFGRPRLGELLPGFLHRVLDLSDEQKTKLEVFHKEAAASLDKLLTPEQKKQLEGPAGGPGFGAPGGFAAMPQPGQIMTLFQQARLKLTADQKKALAELQKKADETLDKTLAERQKKQLKDMREAMNRGGPGRGPGGQQPGGPPGGPRPGGPPGGGRPGFGPPGFGGPPGGASLFRSYRYAADYPGLKGKDLKPGKLIEELEAKEEPAKKPKEK
jgi:hypothetical protein